MVLQYDDVPSSESDQGALLVVVPGSTVNSTEKGWLIDFDFGGTLGEVFYPKAYKGLLYDGTRPGTEGEEITIRDDWKSLIDVILHKYSFDGNAGWSKLTDAEKLIIYQAKEKLRFYLNRNGVDSNDSSSRRWEEPAMLLRNFIDLIFDVNDVEPCCHFKRDLKDWGLMPQSTQ